MPNTTQIDMTDDELVLLEKAILALTGMNKEHDSSTLLEDDNGEMYIKFMSDRGVTDNHNGRVLREYLLSKEVWIHARTMRSMTVSNKDLREQFFQQQA